MERFFGVISNKREKENVYVCVYIYVYACVFPPFPYLALGEWVLSPLLFVPRFSFSASVPFYLGYLLKGMYIGEIL